MKGVSSQRLAALVVLLFGLIYFFTRFYLPAGKVTEVIKSSNISVFPAQFQFETKLTEQGTSLSVQGSSHLPFNPQNILEAINKPTPITGRLRCLHEALPGLSTSINSLNIGKLLAVAGKQPQPLPLPYHLVRRVLAGSQTLALVTSKVESQDQIDGDEGLLPPADQQKYLFKIYELSDTQAPKLLEESQTDDPYAPFKISRYLSSKTLLDERQYQLKSREGRVDVTVRDGQLEYLDIDGQKVRCETHAVKNGETTGLLPLECDCKE